MRIPRVLGKFAEFSIRLGMVDRYECVAATNGSIARDAERVAVINRLMALDAERIQQLSAMEARLLRCGLDRPLAFMHIPKASGSALVTGLIEVLPSTPFLGGFDRSMFGTFEGFDTLPPEVRALIYCDGLRPTDDVDLVAGHFAFSTLRAARPRARLITILREARSRILSLWMFWRALSEEAAWLEVHHRLARNPLIDFLSYPEVAHQTDNVTVRMLLWPHSLIQPGRFIDVAADAQLVAEAAARLKAFTFTDVVENPSLEDNIRDLLARPFVYRRVNETISMPTERRTPLREQLTAETVRLLEHRSRLDRELWLAVARERLGDVDAVALADDVFDKTVTRHGALMTA